MKYSSWTNNRWEVIERPGPSVSIDHIAEFTIDDHRCLQKQLKNQSKRFSISSIVWFLVEFYMECFCSLLHCNIELRNITILII